uniref:Uncharacterized protein n=1 Tax=Setaria digitata TaxID=48799 RepID=A0A915PLP3_9BILA
MEEDMFDGSLLADSPTPSEECSNTEKSRNSVACTSVTATKIQAESSLPHPVEATSSTAVFGITNTFDPLQFDPLRLLMNRSLNAAVLNPILAQPAAMLSLQQQLSRHISSAVIQPSVKEEPSCTSRRHEAQSTETSGDVQTSFGRARIADCENNSTSTSMTPKRSKLLIDEILNLKTSVAYSSEVQETIPDGFSQQEIHRSPSTSREQSVEPNLTKDEKASISDSCVTDAVFVVPATNSNRRASSDTR